MKRTLLLASNLSGAFPIFRDFLNVPEKAELLFIPTAAVGEGWYPVDEEDVQPFRDMGYRVTMFDASEAETVPADFLEDYHAVFVSGGNTFFLLKHLKRCGLFDPLKTAVQDGNLIYLGSSAGSVAATPSIAYADKIDDRTLGDGDDVGFNFVPFSILPHLDHEGMGPAVRAQMDSWIPSDGEVIGLNDGQVIIVEDSGYRIIG